MGSVEPMFCRDIQRGFLGGYFLQECLHLVGSEAGWDVYGEGQVGWGTAVVIAGVRRVCSFLLIGMCLCGASQPGGQEHGCVGLGCLMPRMAAWSHCRF